VRFGGVQALDRVSVELGVGVTGLIGPNGAGKTTLLNVLSGFVRPAAGRVVADGQTDLLRMPPHRRARWGLRRSFQQERLVARLSVRNHLRVTAEHTAAGDIVAAEAVEETLERTGLTAVAERPAATIDQRQRRMLELGRAIVGRPRVILLDEPGAGLDPAETAELLELIKALPTKTGAVVVVIDHDMTLVRGCCTRLAVLDFGRLLASGPLEQVFADPEVRAAYLGSTVDGGSAA
jgi:ABC-type branched-subunit amino acid transport system ATPase component